MPLPSLLILLVEGAGDEVMQRPAGAEDETQDGDDDTLQDDVGQQEQRVGDKEKDVYSIHLLQQGCQQQAQPAQKIRQRLQGAVHHGGKLQCQPCQEAGQPVQQRQQQCVDAVQQQDQDHTVQQGQYGHQELAVAVLPLQVRLHVQQGEQDKGEQADQISRGPEDRLNHTAPPF